MDNTYKNVGLARAQQDTVAQVNKGIVAQNPDLLTTANANLHISIDYLSKEIANLESALEYVMRDPYPVDNAKGAEAEPPTKAIGEIRSADYRIQDVTKRINDIKLRLCL